MGLIGERNGPIDVALRQVEDTEAVLIGSGALLKMGEHLSALWPEATLIVIADRNTWQVAGEAVADRMRAEGKRVETFIFEEERLEADYEHVKRLKSLLERRVGIPLAVGSGTLNDLVKLAAEESGRRYAVYATAASMDGYASYGASITVEGIKRTIWCRAPRLIVADPEILGRAPLSMHASGYADLLAKLTAGADWILADSLGLEPIDSAAWRMTQDSLRRWTSDPDGVGRGSPRALADLFEGLIMAGLGMQAARSSRPASGAEHIFSHLWEMEDRKSGGRAASHGFKVGIGLLASAGLYDFLRKWDGCLDSRSICAAWPETDAKIRDVRSLHKVERIAKSACEVMAIKHPSVATLSGRHERVAAEWPNLRQQIERQVPTTDWIRDHLSRAGAPVDPRQIGLEIADLEASFARAATIRERYTVLDFIVETDLFGRALEHTLKSYRPRL